VVFESRRSKSHCAFPINHPFDICEKKTSSMAFRTDEIDVYIVKLCNELIAEQTSSAKLRAEQQTESRKVVKYYRLAHEEWQVRSKPPKKNATNTTLHQTEVSQVFFKEIEKSRSPFLVSQLSQLCYHMHLMILLETAVQKTIHEDYRAIVNWIHESWEDMDVETKGINEEAKTVRMEIQELRNQQAKRMKELEDRHTQERQELLGKRRLEILAHLAKLKPVEDEEDVGEADDKDVDGIPIEGKENADFQAEDQEKISTKEQVPLAQMANPQEVPVFDR
jgi:hypothetical protein